MSRGVRDARMPPSRFALYERAVQNAEHEIALFSRVFTSARGRPPTSLREDFAGSAWVATAWVASARDRTAFAVDHDDDALAYARATHAAALDDDARARLVLVKDDVRTVGPNAVDVVCAENFSYCVFHTRAELETYFAFALENLNDEGMLFLDVQGGPRTQREGHEDRRAHDGFTSIWRQERFDPIAHRARFTLDFDVEGHGRVAGFTYDWRVWTIPEIAETLAAVGFSSNEVFWPAETGTKKGVYRRRTEAPAEEHWVAYVIARR